MSTTPHVLLHCAVDEVIVITETWLLPGINFGEVIAKTHSCHRTDIACTKKSGGGVLIAIKRTMISSTIELPTNYLIEVCAVNIERSEDSQIVLVVLYSTAHKKAQQADELKSIIKIITEDNKLSNLIIIGDFKVPFIYLSQPDPDYSTPYLLCNMNHSFTPSTCNQNPIFTDWCYNNTQSSTPIPSPPPPPSSQISLSPVWSNQ